MSKKFILAASLVAALLAPLAQAQTSKAGKPRPVASKTPAGPQLQLKVKQLTIAVGEARAITWTGGGKELPQVQGIDEDSATIELSPGRCRITGKKSGDFNLVLDWGKPGLLWSIPISFRFPAGNVPDPMVVSVTGTQDPAEALKHLMLDRQRPQASSEISLEADPKNPDAYRAKVAIYADGFLPVNKSVHLAIEHGSLTPSPAQLLYLSNRPEKLSEPGILFDQPWTGQGSCRWLFHHKYVATAGQPDLWLELRCRNRGQTPASFHLVLSSLGPARDEIYVGHLATKNFIQKVTGPSLASWQITVPVGHEECLERLRLKPGQTVSGLALLVPDGPLSADLRVVATELDGSGGDQLMADQGQPGRTARGVFPAEISQSYSYRAGEKYLYIQLGGPPYLVDAGSAEKSPGNFGAVYLYSIHLANPTSESYDYSISASARGGPARGHIYLDGVLKDPGNIGANPTVLQNWHLAPGEERNVVLETLPQSGSNYPVSLVVGAVKSKSQEFSPSTPETGTIPRMIP